ncbi:MAG: hypothetical protein EOP34_02255 [Rickettsiales bacterium]|nr:MAG: hypothetical protein EOP34_02255 [Rickettsiales bacterium]
MSCAFTDSQISTPYPEIERAFLEGNVSEAKCTLYYIKRNFSHIEQLTLISAEHNFEITDKHFNLMKNNCTTRTYRENLQRLIDNNIKMVFNTSDKTINHYFKSDERDKYFPNSK